MNRLSLIFVTALIFSAINASAGVLIKVENKFYGKSARQETSHISVEGKKLRVDHYRKKKAIQDSVIYRGDKDFLQIINHKKKQYTTLDKKTIQALAAQANQATQQMDAALEDMPPLKRKLMEKMLKKKKPKQQKPVELKVKKTKETKTIIGYPCTKYEVWRGKEKVHDVWATQWKRAGVKGTVDQVVRDMHRFYEEAFSALGSNPLFRSHQPVLTRTEKINGAPVLTKDYENSKLVSESLIKSIEDNAKFSKNFFSPPAKFKEKPLKVK